MDNFDDISTPEEHLNTEPSCVKEDSTINNTFDINENCEGEFVVEDLVETPWSKTEIHPEVHELRKWVIENKIPHVHVDKLLDILRPRLLPE